MKKIMYWLPSIIFNVMEFLVVILIGELLRLNIKQILSLVFIFSITRMILKGAIHYKDWKRCFIMTTLFFFSLFIVAKVDYILGILLTFFEALILTKKGDINDIFMWSSNTLNKEVFEWVKFNQDNPKLKEYEEKLKQTDKKKYYIFEYRFREFKGYKEIDELMDLGGTPRVAEELNIISHFIEYSIRLD